MIGNPDTRFWGNFRVDGNAPGTRPGGRNVCEPTPRDCIPETSIYCDKGSTTVCDNRQALVCSRDLKVFADGPELSFRCAGKVETLRFALVSH